MRCFTSACTSVFTACTSLAYPRWGAVHRRFLLKHSYKRLRHDIEVQEGEHIEDKVQEAMLIGHNAVQWRRGLYRPFHPVEVQIRYMESEAYQESYRGAPIYIWYRRRVRGQPKLAGPPRFFCISRDGTFDTNNPCPICRDEYLWFDYRNPKLIKMFLKQGSQEPINPKITGLCIEQQQRLDAEVIRCKEHGTLDWCVPHRNYNYRQYYPDWQPDDDEPIETRAVLDVVEPITELTPQRHIVHQTHMPDQNADWDPYWIRWERFVKRSK